MKYDADYLVKEWNAEIEIDGKWYVARPINNRCRGIFERISDAWSVFIGKADPVTFKEQRKP